MGSQPQDVLALFDRAAWIITARSGERMSGLVATFVNSASLVPSLPRLAIGIACHHRTWELIAASRAFAAHLVDEGASELMWRFGLESGRTCDKFAGISWQPGRTDSPILTAALASLECTVETELNIGDRTIFVGAVVAGGVHGPGVPLTAKRLFELATPDRRARLEAARVRDEQIDEAALLAWRAAQGQ
jgi:flavin reductase (DIM6/NTAB) family NADH-FMN oxidoreductase RutF